MSEHHGSAGPMMGRRASDAHSRNLAMTSLEGPTGGERQCTSQG